MQDKINQKNWRSKIPFGVIVTWFLSGLSVLFHLHMVVEKCRLKIGTITSLQTVVSAQFALVCRKGVHIFQVSELARHSKQVFTPSTFWSRIQTWALSTLHITQVLNYS